MSETKPAGEPITITDGESTVTVQKVFTRMGERLEITAHNSNQSIRLDAIMLESVTWQDPSDLTEPGTASEIHESPNPSASRSEEQITISSEFALAIIEPVPGDDTVHITAPKLGYAINLGPPELEWLTTQDHTTFTEWLEHPFGPDADDHDH